MTLRVSLLHAWRDAANPSMRRYASGLGAALERRGLSVTHLAPGPAIPAGLLRSPVLSRMDGLWGRYVRYPALARHAEGDVLHVVDHSHAHLLAHIRGGRAVATCHDVILLALAAGRVASDHRDPAATALFRRDVAHLRRAAAVVADSERTRQDVVDLVGVRPEAVEVIAPGLDPAEPVTPEERAEARRRVGGDGPLVLHVGHAGFYKNLEACLEVLARLRKGGIGARLLRGGETLRESQRALAGRLGVAGAVLDRGPVSEGGLRELYAAADVLLFPSLYEGFGWPPLEAMAAGVPVVCADTGSLPEVVGDAALVAGPHDHDGLAGHVAELLSRPARADELRRRGRARAATYSWDATAGRMESLYRRVVDAA